MVPRSTHDERRQTMEKSQSRGSKGQRSHLFFRYKKQIKLKNPTEERESGTIRGTSTILSSLTTELMMLVGALTRQGRRILPHSVIFYNNICKVNTMRRFTIRSVSISLLIACCWAASSIFLVVVVHGITPANSRPDRREAVARAMMMGVVAPLVSTNILIPPPRSWGANNDDGDSSTTMSRPPPSPMMLHVVHDPQTYSALAYSPPRPQTTTTTTMKNQTPPLIVVLHGAGRNDLDIRKDLADPNGEHAGLIPSLIASGQAPPVLLENFAILAPYSQGRPSFYQDSRSQLLNFIEWAIKKNNDNSSSSSSCGIPHFDPNRIFLFGFSDGATVAVELMTTRRFAGAVICSYGYTGGALPSKAVERLADLPMWVFHSADDVIFNVSNSDRLVQQLRKSAADATTTRQKDDDDDDDTAVLIRYNRYDQDPEQLPPRVRGHSMGITASKLPEVYDWMLQQPPLSVY